MKPGLRNGSNLSSILATKVRITEISLRLREISGIKAGLVRAASLLMDRGKDRNGLVGPRNNRVWASLARYDDDLVDALESWEQSTRDNTNLGRRKSESSESVSGIFASDKWDKEKMVRTFARMGDDGKRPSEMNGTDEVRQLYDKLIAPPRELTNDRASRFITMFSFR